MTSEILSRLEGLGFPIEELTVADVLGTLKRSTEVARAKGDSDTATYLTAQAGRIRDYREDYLKLLGIDGDYEPKAGELIGHLERNEKSYSQDVYLWSLKADIVLLKEKFFESLLYNVVKEYMSEVTPEIEAEAWKWKEVIDGVITRDSLTGLRNRKGLFENLEDQIDTFHKSKTKFSSMLIDVDGFKEVNDSRGHDVGNEVLINLAKDFKEEFEGTGEPFRLHGDEFVVLIPKEGVGQAEKKAQKLKKRINKNYKDYGLTLSIGVAEMSEDMLQVANSYDLIDPKSLILALADSATYLAKDQGKNQVVNWEQVTKPKALAKGASQKEKQMHKALKDLIKRRGQD